ncbi:MAG: helix-turn-helix transcriptional regulator, partial [Pseudonocardiaceae bacterium]
MAGPPAGWQQASEPDNDVPELGNTYSREALKRLSQRIYFDTADWYWKDEGSGHLPAVRYALLTGMALKLTTRVKSKAEPTVTIVKPYGIVWKAGEWHLVAAPIDEPPTRYRLNLVDHLALTDLRFSYPDEEFHLQSWWASAMEAHGKGETRIVLVSANAGGQVCDGEPAPCGAVGEMEVGWPSGASLRGAASNH